jgi:hypothetical protein
MKKNITKYIHIGCPKSLSTSLQRGFFSQNKEIFHLGPGLKNDNLGYIDDEINIYMEVYMRYAKYYFYDLKKDLIKDSFQEKFRHAQKNGYGAVGISCELMSFSYSPSDVDVIHKIKRLHDAFGSDTKIIMIIRNQFDLIKSLYGEYVKVGYPNSYREFMEYLYKFQDRTFVSDFFYDYIYSLCADLFGKKNILVIPLEALREVGSGRLIKNDDNIAILRIISEFLNLSKTKYSNLDHFNVSLQSNVLAIKQKLNKKQRHDYGNSMFGTAENQRLMKYFEKDLKILPPREAMEDVLTKRKLIVQAIELAKQEPNLEVDYSYDDEIRQGLYDMYAKSNKRFFELTNINLESLKYPYPK